MRLTPWLLGISLVCLPLAGLAQPRPPGPGPAAPKKSVAQKLDYDFTPRTADLVEGGARRKVTHIMSGPMPVRLGEPDGWTFQGTRDSLFLVSSKHPSARITLRNSSIPATKQITDDWLRPVTALVPKLAPAGSQRVEVKGPDRLGTTRVRYTLRYNLTGQIFVTSLLLIAGENTPTIELIATSNDVDSAAVQAAANSVIGGWRIGPIVALAE